jgi:hypothetical protein
VADVALADLERERPLGAEHQGAAPVEHGREAEQVVRARTPAVEGEDRRERARAGRDVRGVEEIHRRNITPGGSGVALC